MKRLYEIIKFPTEKNLEKNEKLKAQISTWMKRSGVNIPYLDEGMLASIFEGEFEKYFSVKESRNETEKTGTLLFNKKDKNQPSFRFHRATRFHNKEVELKIPLLEDPNDTVEDKTEVLDGAILKCSLGGSPSNLNVTSHNKVYVKNRLVATIKDSKGEENIKSFGECKKSHSCPCIPKIVGMWTKGSEKISISDYAVLLNNDTCMCSEGGKITIEQPLGKVKIIK